MSEIINAKITGTSLGWEDHGILTAWITLEMDGSGISMGGFALDEWDEGLDRRIDKQGLTGEYIRAVLETLELEKWEDLKGTYVRLDSEGWGGRALGIGHLMKDKWFRPDEFFKKYFNREEK